jgi:protein gp37
MGKTSIEWTDKVWNCVRGCSRVSEGCRNCYAERIAARFSAEDGDPRLPFSEFAIMTPAGPRWTGRVELIESKLLEPLSWRKPCRVFVNSMSDLFHENLPDEAIDRVFAVMALCTHITFQVLTKRAERMRRYMDVFGDGRRVCVNDQIGRWMQFMDDFPKGRSFPRFCEQWPLANVWLGVSVEDQKTADERIQLLLKTPAAVRFVSAEPLLGPVDFRQWLRCVACAEGRTDESRDRGDPCQTIVLDQIIVGGESGPGARPCRVEWVESIIEQCRAAGVACFVKQLGAYPVWAGAKSSPINGGHGKNGEPKSWPEALRVREFPEVRR